MECIPKSLISGSVKVSGTESKPEKLAMLMRKYKERIDMVESTAKETDPELWNYILIAVTEGAPYTKLQTQMDIPCCRDTFYDRYRKFFWTLSNVRE